MWIWREGHEDTAGGAFDRHERTAGGWHLDRYGTWSWSEWPLGGDVDDAMGVGPGAGAGGLALLPSPAFVDVRADDPAEETPIFHAVSDDHSRRSRPRHIDGQPAWAAIPEPHPGSGALPVQDPSSGGRRSGHLAPVPTVPPPGPHDDEVGRSEDPADEVRRRAERRRRPQAEPASTGTRGSGRHALREEKPDGGGRHALGG